MKREFNLTRKKRSERGKRTQSEIADEVRRFLNPNGIDVDPEALAEAFRRPLIEMLQGFQHHSDPHLDAIMRRDFDPEARAYVEDLLDAALALSDPRQPHPDNFPDAVFKAMRLHGLPQARRDEATAHVRDKVIAELRQGRSIREIAREDFSDGDGQPLTVHESTLRRLLAFD